MVIAGWEGAVDRTALREGLEAGPAQRAMNYGTPASAS
jgi:hypothetical protein